MHNNQATTLRLKQQTYIFLIYTIKGEFPWLCFCAGRFEVTNVGEHYNLMEVFAEEAMELKVTQ